MVLCRVVWIGSVWSAWVGGSALRLRLLSGRSPSLCLGWWFFPPLSTSLLWSCLPFPPFGGGAFSSSSDESLKLPPGTRCARVVSMCMPRSHNRYDSPMHLVATLRDDSKPTPSKPEAARHVLVTVASQLQLFWPSHVYTHPTTDSPNTYFSTCCSRGSHARCDHISKLTLR